MSEFRLFSVDLHFSDAADRYFQKLTELRSAAEAAAQDMKAFYLRSESIEAVIDNYPSELTVITQRRVVDALFKELPSLEIYDISRSVFEESCWDLSASERYFNEVVKAYNEIRSEQESKKEYRAARKASRGRWDVEVSSFGASLENMATAGVLNLASGVVHGVFNAVGNYLSSVAADKAKKQLYAAEQTLNLLCQGVKDCVESIYSLYMGFINGVLQQRGEASHFDGSCFSPQKAIALFDNAKSLPEKREELLVKAVQACPYNEELLKYIFLHYEDERKNTVSAAKHFCVDMTDSFETLLASVYRKELQESEEACLSAKSAIETKMAELGVSSSQTLHSAQADCLLWIYNRRYRDLLALQRQGALAEIRAFDAPSQVKKDFIASCEIWELASEYGVEYDAEAKEGFVAKTYAQLFEAKADHETMKATMDYTLSVLGFAHPDSNLRKRFFLLLSGIKALRKLSREERFEAKEELLNPIAKSIEDTVVRDGIAGMTTSLTYRAGQAQNRIAHIKYANLEVGETALLVYDAKPFANPGAFGFVLTDRRLIAKPLAGETFALSLQDIETFSLSVYTPARLTAHAGTALCMTEIDNLHAPEKFVQLLCSVQKQLVEIAQRIAQEEALWQSNYRAETARCIRENPFLVEYFGMEEREILEEGAQQITPQESSPLCIEAPADAQEKTEIEALLQSCERSDLQAVLTLRDRLLDGNFDPENTQKYIDELSEVVRRHYAECTEEAQLCSVRAILQAHNADGRYQTDLERIEQKLQSLDEATRTYRGIVFASAQEVSQAQQYEYSLDICMRSVSRDNLQSIDNAIAQVELCPSRIKERYLDILNGYRREYEDKQRTFRGIVFDSAQQADAARGEYALIRDMVHHLDHSDENAVRAAYDKVRSCPYAVVGEYEAQLKARLDAFDIANRTVDGILFETSKEAEIARQELCIIGQIMAALDQENEPLMIDSRNRLAALTSRVKCRYIDTVDAALNAYDLKQRTFRGVLYDTRERVQLLRREEALVPQLMHGVCADNEQSMLCAKEKLSQLQTFLKDEPLAAVERMLHDYDIRMRTFNGLLYSTREEAALARAEYQQAMAIMQTVCADDEASILSAQTQILKLTTGIRDVQYRILNDMWEAYDLKQRTYEGMVFETREQARTAKTTREEFLRLFYTHDLRSRETVLLLENYVEDTLHERIRPEALRMIADIKELQSLLAEVISADQRIDPTVSKKESAELYKRAEKLRPRMLQYRMDVSAVQAIMDRHYASLNVAQKVFSFFKRKG